MGILELGQGTERAWAFAWERDLVVWLSQQASPLLDMLIVPISFVGEWGACWLLVMAVLWWRGRTQPHLRRLSVRFAGALFLGSVLLLLPLRHLGSRDRPHQVLPVAQKSLAIRGHSFPSGHAHSAWVAVFLLGRTRRLRLGLALFAVAMCISRVYCGMHFPIDVLVGGALGAAVGALVLHFERRGALGPTDLEVRGQPVSAPT